MVVDHEDLARHDKSMIPFQDHILVFTTIMLIILMAPLLAARIKVPDLVLLLLAGMALGTNGFGVLERNQAIELFGDVGLVYIMFLAGLEVDLYQFSRTKGKSMLFGLITFLLPQLVGGWVVYKVLGLSWQGALLMASMFASHTLLAYPVTAKLGIQRIEPVTISVGATIITDTLALLVLAVIVDAAEGIAMDLKFWVSLLAALLLMVVLISQIIPRLARWFFRNVPESGGAQFLFVITVVCACAYFSQFARMKPIIGAFLAGAAFNRQIPEHSPLMNRLLFVGEVMFIPFFLISVGMLVDPAALVGDSRTWLVMGVMCGMVIVTKLGAAFLTGSIFRYSARESMLMFGLTVVQAAATLAAALVAFETGLLDESALNGAVAMILVTVPLGSAVVQQAGRKLALSDEKPRALEAPREQRILLPVEQAESATRQMRLAFLLRDISVPGGIFPLAVVREQTDTDEAIARGEKLLAECMTMAASAEMGVEAQVRVELNPVDGMVRAAKELRTGTLLAGWPRSSRLFTGTAEQLEKRCPARLIFARLPRPINNSKSVRLVLPPLSEYRRDLDLLLREAKRLAKQVGAPLFLYHSGKQDTDILDRLKKIRPACEVSLVEGQTWKAVRQKLFADTKKEDLLILSHLRKDSALWTPTLNRLPEIFVEHFPHSNLLVVYPGLQENPGAGDVVPHPIEPGTPRVIGVELEARPRDGAVIEQLLARSLRSDPQMAAEALPLLVDSASITPVPLAEDVLLLHAHCGEKEAPLLLIGHSGEDPDERSFFEQVKRPRVLVALLSPKGDAPEIHLRSLATVAKHFRRKEVKEALEASRDAASLADLIQGAFEESSG